MAVSPVAIIPIGQNMVTAPSEVVSETSFMYALNNCKSVVVTFIPGIVLPEGTACAVYAVSAASATAAVSSGQTPGFQFLGAIGSGQESASFEVDKFASPQGIALGIDIESQVDITIKLKTLPSPETKATATPEGQEKTLALAQAIIGNAFDFIASFSGSSGLGGVEVVPLKAFENWWKKFESRVRSDPSFLERKD